MHRTPYVEQRMRSALRLHYPDIFEEDIEARMLRNPASPEGMEGPASVPVHAPPQIMEKAAVIPANPPTAPLPQPVAVECPLWDAVSIVFRYYRRNVPTTIDQISERISTSFTRWIERNHFATRMKTAEDAVNNLCVYQATSHNDIQTFQDEGNARRETNLPEPSEELEEFRDATERVKARLNDERGQTGELLQEREAVEAFIDTVRHASM